MTEPYLGSFNAYQEDTPLYLSDNEYLIDYGEEYDQEHEYYKKWQEAKDYDESGQPMATDHGRISDGIMVELNGEPTVKGPQENLEEAERNKLANKEMKAFLKAQELEVKGPADN
jgi:uncharacterized UPF0160 family protein